MGRTRPKVGSPHHGPLPLTGSRRLRTGYPKNHVHSHFVDYSFPPIAPFTPPPIRNKRGFASLFSFKKSPSKNLARRRKCQVHLNQQRMMRRYMPENVVIPPFGDVKPTQMKPHRPHQLVDRERHQRLLYFHSIGNKNLMPSPDWVGQGQAGMGTNFSNHRSTLVHNVDRLSNVSHRPRDNGQISRFFGCSSVVWKPTMLTWMVMLIFCKMVILMFTYQHFVATAFVSLEIFHGTWAAAFTWLAVLSATNEWFCRRRRQLWSSSRVLETSSVMASASCLLAGYLPSMTVLHILLIPSTYPFVATIADAVTTFMAILTMFILLRLECTEIMEESDEEAIEYRRHHRGQRRRQENQFDDEACECTSQGSYFSETSSTSGAWSQDTTSTDANAEKKPCINASALDQIMMANQKSVSRQSSSVTCSAQTEHSQTKTIYGNLCGPTIITITTPTKQRSNRVTTKCQQTAKLPSVSEPNALLFLTGQRSHYYCSGDSSSDESEVNTNQMSSNSQFDKDVHQPAGAGDMPPLQNIRIVDMEPMDLEAFSDN